MPISSGATLSQKQGSYLKRYLARLPQEERKVLERSLEAVCVSQQAGEEDEDLPQGVQEEEEEEEHSEEVQSEERDTAGEQTTSKKSSTCTVL
ncbi:PAX-interacting protein 1-like [Clarias gariepinus]|uniref:PAX-interacting protein 1-like n=1 Tax=Clarias gariepinus TaxID=13013 RepID=UPI00234D331A|nr:PAX-interacting protein 1-like [Clarias gariepinus]